MGQMTHQRHRLSVVPGRAQSAMGGFGAVVVGVIGVVWTIAAASMGAPWFFVAFGVVFVLCAIVGCVFHFYNAGAGDRVPFVEIESEELGRAGDATYCTSCGTRIEASHRFCGGCGRGVERAASDEA